MSETWVGCAGETLDVPLFVELYGYGPFLGRRNRGTRDPLWCRAVSFRNGPDRVMLINSDLVTMDAAAAWEVRSELAEKLRFPETNILVSATHTHSGPTISKGIGWGEWDADFQRQWVRRAIAVGLKAAADESPVTADYGTARLSATLGKNRVEPDGPTDPDIRWVRFRRPDGGVKLLLHNHGMHGVVFGPKMLLVSADWPGAVNARILEENLADNVLFLQGAAGDINTDPVARDLAEGGPHLKRISESYAADLKASLAGPGKPLALFPLKAVLESVKLPTEDTSPAELRETAAKAREMNAATPYLIDRLEEMALFMEAGNSLDVIADLQALRIGGLYVYAFPGEPFYALGRELMAKSPGEFALVAEVANGNCRYFPTPETFAKHPSVLAEKRGYGFYEIHQGCGRFMPKYKAHIAPFLIERFLASADKLA